MPLIVDDRGKRVLTNEITYKNVIVRHMSSYSPVVSHDRRQHVKPGAPFASYRSFIANQPMLCDKMLCLLAGNSQANRL